MSNAPQADPELKKAFEDLQVKMLSTRSQMKIINMQVDQLKRQIQHSKLTEKELQQLDENINLYEGIGRMFVLKRKTVVLNNLNEKIGSYETKIVNFDKSKGYLESNLKDSENSLRELINIKKEKF
jgi:prefoldin subunit 1